MTRPRFQPPEVCPVCGEDVPRQCKACPECGADERSGWNEDAARYDGLDLPDEAFGDAEVERRAAGQSPLGWLWWATAVVLLVAWVLSFVL